MADVERRLFVMLKNDSIRDMKKHELAQRFQQEEPLLTKNYAEYLAGKVKRASQRKDLGYFEALKILGIISDTTARDAIQNMEQTA